MLVFYKRIQLNTYRIQETSSRIPFHLRVGMLRDLLIFDIVGAVVAAFHAD